MAITVPQDLAAQKSFSIRKKRFHMVEYTSSTSQSLNDVLLSEHAIVYIQQGEKIITIDETSHRIQSGELFLLTKGHYIMSEYTPDKGEFRSIMLFFNHHLVSEISHIMMGGDLKIQGLEAIQVLPENRHIRQFFNSFSDIMSDKEQFMIRELLEIKIKELVYILLASAQNRASVISFLKSVYKTEHQSINTVIHNNLYKKISLEALAMLSCMSVSTFKRMFAKEFGTSPIKYINDKRLEKALLLIQNTQQQIVEIAYECGFENYAHFSRCFKSKYGTSANKIRANM